MKTSIRENAVEVLLYVDNNGYLKDSLEKKYKNIEDERDRRLLHEITYGVVRNQIYLDYIIEKFLKKNKKPEKKIQIILRIALFQMYFLDKIPEHAILNEAVESAKKIVGFNSTSFVNGILRNILRNKKEAFEVNEKDPYLKLSIEYSFPYSWVKYFQNFFPLEELKKFLYSNNLNPPFTIRAVGIKRDDLANTLLEAGFDLDYCKYSDQALSIKNPSNIFNHPLYKNGNIYVQDEASQMVVKQFTKQGTYRALDVCAAPGGKTFQLMEYFDLGVVASDISKKRLKILLENKNRLKLPEVPLEVIQHNASMVKREWHGLFDRILVDAPCSGLGLIRRKPEIKNRIKLQDSKDLSKVQLKILESAAYSLSINGELVYSTCTVTKEENEYVINEFLEKHKNFTVQKDWVRFWPHIHSTDGFSMICLKRMR